MTAGASAHAISPGGSNAVGILNTGSLYLNSNTTLDFSNISSPSNMDQIVSTGSLNLSGGNTATLILPGSLAANTYTLIDAATLGNVTDNTKFIVFGGLPPRYSLSWSGAPTTCS